MRLADDSIVRLWLMPTLVWIALLVLLSMTVGSAYVPLGAFNTAINMAIAAAKVALIVLFFMQLRSASALLRLASLAGVFWLVFMFALTAGDYLTRR